MTSIRIKYKSIKKSIINPVLFVLYIVIQKEDNVNEEKFFVLTFAYILYIVCIYR